MRVLVVSENVFLPAVKMTGVINIYQLQCELARLGVEVHILTSVLSWRAQGWQKWFETEQRNLGIKFHYIPVALDQNSMSRFLQTKSFFLRKSVQLHKAFKFDLLHQYTSSPRLISLAALDKLLLGIPVVNTLSGYNRGLFDSILAIAGIGYLDKVICGNKDIKRRLNQLYPKIHNKTIYLPLGINVDGFACQRGLVADRKSLGIGKCDPVILFLGPLEPRKGVFTLARCVSKVVKRYPRARFVFASYGRGGVDPDHDLHESEVRKIASSPHNLIIVKGQLNVSSFISLCDIFVLPLDDLFGTHAEPSTLLEAMYHQKPIISSDVRGIRELISDEENGLLFPPQDSNALSSQLIRLLDSESLRRKLARKTCLPERYRLKNVARQLFSLYLELKRKKH